MSTLSPNTADAASVSGGLDEQTLAGLRESFASDPRNRLMQNAVTQTAVDDVALNREIITSTDHTFSHHLDDWEVTNQKSSGRCWMFAGLNLTRFWAMKKMELQMYDVSQNSTLFCATL